jgi:hypothetical protein
MTEQDMPWVETTVGASLPPRYQRFLLHHTKTLQAARRKLNRPILYSSPEAIIWINKGLRDNRRMIEVNEDADPCR